MRAGFLAMKEGRRPEPALRQEFDPHLLAARTFVHAQGTAGSDIQDFVCQPGRSATMPAPDLSGIVEKFGLCRLVEGHFSAPARLIFKILESAALSPSVHDRTRCERASTGQRCIAAATGA
jgi:hypothetical protein